MSFRPANQLFTIYIIFRVTSLVRDSARKRTIATCTVYVPPCKCVLFTLFEKAPTYHCFLLCSAGYVVDLPISNLKRVVCFLRIVLPQNYSEITNSFGRVTALSIWVPLGRNKTQKELQSFTVARGFLNSHKKIDLSFKYMPEEWEDKLEWLRWSLHMRNEKRKLKS